MNINLKDLKISHISNQLLWETPNKIKPSEIARKLSYIQLDTVSAIARHQDILCHTRSSSYKEKEVWKYLKKANLFEDYAHGVCLLPIEHLPYYYAKRIMRRKSVPDWLKKIKNYKNWIDEILQFIEENGLTSVKDIDVPFKHKTAIWEGRPNRWILDYLCYRGYLAVAERKNFQPYYDLSERVFKDLEFPLPTPLEKFLFDIRTTLNANGATPFHRLISYKYTNGRYKVKGKNKNAKDIVLDEIQKGNYYQFEVEGLSDKIVMNKDTFENFDNIADKDPEEYPVTLLSPWDSVLLSRESLLDQYDYDYKMEVYVPAKKRNYGYYVMPILWGIEFVGRVDVKYERKTKKMNFIKWYWENNFKPPNPFLENLSTFLNRFLKFHGAQKFNLGNLNKNYKSKLQIEV